MRNGLITALVGLLAALLAPSTASAHTVASASADLQPLVDRWIERAQMPTAPEVIDVFSATCFDGVERSCTTSDVNAIWLDPRAGREDFWHELGHRFDYAMSDRGRRRFLAVTDQRDRPWRSPPDSPHEQFAEAWRLCAADPREPALTDVAYGYWPGRRMHRRVCRTIRREAERQGWVR